MSFLPDILFKGVPRGATRGYTTEVLQKIKPEIVCIPCVGAFALATATVRAGIPPANIVCCDISLYTSVIGAYLTGDDLEIEPASEWKWLGEYMTDPTGKAAAIILAIRILQYTTKKETIFRSQRIRELRERAAEHIEYAKVALVQMHEELAGIRYQAEDMWDLMERYREDPNTVILCNPPRYTGGYDKMYEGIDEAFSWDAPSVAQFTEDDYPRLMEWLGEGAASTFVYYATPVKTSEDPAEEFGSPWKSVFASRPRTGKTAAINWIMANHSKALEEKLKRKDTPGQTDPKYKLFTEGEISTDSILLARMEKRDVVSYYWDLLVHKLALVNTERYVVLLLDGKLLSAIGYRCSNFHTGKDDAINLTLCFSPHHPQYSRLHKLSLLSVTSSWFWDTLLNDIEETPKAVQTTMLSPYPESKTARGIFKLQQRDEEDGEYKLNYRSPVVERTPQETIALWLEKWGHVKK